METVGTIPVGDRKLGIAEVTPGGPVLLGPKKWQPRVYFHDVSCSMVKISVFKLVIFHHVSCVSWSSWSWSFGFRWSFHGHFPGFRNEAAPRDVAAARPPLFDQCLGGRPWKNGRSVEEASKIRTPQNVHREQH